MSNSYPDGPVKPTKRPLARMRGRGEIKDPATEDVPLVKLANSAVTKVKALKGKLGF